MPHPLAIAARLLSTSAAVFVKSSPKKLGKVFKILGAALDTEKFAKQLYSHFKMGTKQSTPLVSRDQFNAMSSNINNVIKFQEKENMRNSFHSELPFHTDTIFLILVVVLVLIALAGATWLLAKYSAARKEGRTQRAARVLNIETGGIGAPKHVVTAVSPPRYPDA